MAISLVVKKHCAHVTSTPFYTKNWCQRGNVRHFLFIRSVVKFRSFFSKSLSFQKLVKNEDSCFRTQSKSGLSSSDRSRSFFSRERHLELTFERKNCVRPIWRKYTYIEFSKWNIWCFSWLNFFSCFSFWFYNLFHSFICFINVPFSFLDIRIIFDESCLPLRSHQFPKII